MEHENPFHYGSPASGSRFADREDELKGISGRMLNGINIILLSPRRYGKTSLLLEAIAEVRKQRGRSGYASFLRCSTHRDVAEAIMTALLKGPLSWVTTQRQKFMDLVGRMRLSPFIEVDQDGSLRASVRPLTDENVNWRETIARAMRLLNEAQEGKRPVSLVLDEFQQVAEIDPGLPGLFKVMADELRDVSLVFSGSKMHVMRRIAIGPSAPLMGMGEVFSLGPVPEDAMVAFLTRRARSGGKQLSPAVARLIYGLADAVPNDVQRLAFECFALAGAVIDETTVDAAMRSVVSHWSVDYEEKFMQLAPSQRRVLQALALHPSLPIFGKEFVATVDVANAGTVRKALTVLEEEELVARRGSNWTVADPFFRAWLREGPA